MRWPAPGIDVHSWTPQVYEHPNGKGPLVCAESPPNHKQVTAATAAIAVKVKKAKFHVGASCRNCNVLGGFAWNELCP